MDRPRRRVPGLLILWAFASGLTPRLNAKPRGQVVYYDAQAPCACVADGVAIATVASPGNALMMATEAPAGAMAVVASQAIEEGVNVADSWRRNSRNGTNLMPGATTP
jgi:hypothetical protein